MSVKVQIIFKSAPYHLQLIVESGEGCKNHAVFHEESLTFVCELFVPSS